MYNFTPKELELVPHILSHSSVREIATQLNRSHRTVECHLRAIYIKLGVNNTGSPRSRAKEILSKTATKQS